MALMIGPRVPDEALDHSCLINIDLPGPFGFSLNCDSPDFMRFAQKPSLLLEEKNVRQARPGLILLAWAISMPLRPLKALLPYLKASAYHPRVGDEKAQGALYEFLPIYAAYILINIAILIFGFTIYLQLMEPTPEYSLPLAFIGCFILFNDVAKAFFWSPHTQLFNIVVPILCLWGCIRTWRDGLFYEPRIFLISFLVGLGITAYATFALFLPSVLLAAFIRAIRKKEDARTIASFFLRAFLVSGIMFVPYLSWYLLVQNLTGSFYQYEIEHYGQIVWIIPAVKSGILNFLSTIASLIGRFLLGALRQGVPLFFLIVVSMYLCYIKKIKKRNIVQDLKPVIAAGVWVAILFLLLLLLLGFYASRLTYTLVAPLIVLSGYLMKAVHGHTKGISRTLLNITTICTVVLFAVYTVAKYGPYA